MPVYRNYSKGRRLRRYFLPFLLLTASIFLMLLLATGGSILDAFNTRKINLSFTGDAITALAYSPDGRVFVSGSADGEIIMWDAAKPSLRTARTFPDQNGAITDLAFVPGRMLFLSTGAQVTLWDASTQRAIARYDTSAYGDSYTVVVSPDARTAYVGTNTHILILNLEARDNFANFSSIAAGNLNQALAISADGTLLLASQCTSEASICTNSNVLLIEISSAQLRSQFAVSGETLDLAFTRDNDVIVAGCTRMRDELCESGYVEFRRGATGVRYHSIQNADTVSDMAFSESSRRLVISTQRAVSIIDVERTRLVTTTNLDNVHGRSTLAIHPDGNTVLVGGCAQSGRRNACSDSKIFLWQYH